MERSEARERSEKLIKKLSERRTQLREIGTPVNAVVDKVEEAIKKLQDQLKEEERAASGDSEEVQKLKKEAER